MINKTLFIHAKPTDYRLVGAPDSVLYQRHDEIPQAVDRLLVEKIREWYVPNDLAESERAVNGWAFALGDSIGHIVCDESPNAAPHDLAKRVVKTLLRSLNIRFTTVCCQTTAQFTLQDAPFKELPRHQRLLAESALRIMLQQAIAVVDEGLHVRLRVSGDSGHIVIA